MIKAKIYKPCKTAMQSGHGKTDKWVLEYERPHKIGPEPLMGWTSSEDTFNQVSLKFETLEQAVARAEKEGFDYTVVPSHQRRVKPRNYGDNFIYRPADESAAK
ncbi:MAG: ETC complex I subunit [Alphaproteobacteria bacterium]